MKSSVLVVKAIALRVNIGSLVPAAYNVLPDTSKYFLFTDYISGLPGA